MKLSFITAVILLFDSASCYEINNNLPYNTVSHESKEQYLMTSDGVKLYIKTSSEGTPCIFVHGGPGAWSASFERLGGNVLEKCLQMIYYDQRGSGRSENALNGDYSLDRMVQDVEEMRQCLGFDKVYLLSHSFGGIIAVNYAAKYPSHLQGLILLNSTVDMEKSLKDNMKHGRWLLGLPLVDTAAIKKPLLEAFMEVAIELNKKGIHYKTIAEEKETNDLLNSIDSQIPSDRAFAREVWNYLEYFKDYARLTASIEVPVLIIVGKKDFAVGPDHHKHFQFKNSQLKEIDGSHSLYYENNQNFYEAICSFTCYQSP